ncbi:chymotrypsin-1-like [Harpegnathos saltator]|uniref:chymotrypsin-1-like n=1 Tax=Harpegnathos saltator TaxID=610380 RepID=UPI000DBED4A2|nr:chymotrypsin-1-like [Harpegnathos saltator]
MDENDNKKMVVVTGTIVPLVDGERHEIRCMRLHPEYDNTIKTSWKNDVAVITWKTPVKPNNYQSPIPLASKDHTTSKYYGTINGCGRIGVNLRSALMLKYVDVNVLSQEQCLNSHNNPPTNTKHVCTLDRIGTEACDGDSGGPLIVNGEFSGVLSWVTSCVLGKPDVLTNVYYFRDFIRSAQLTC